MTAAAAVAGALGTGLVLAARSRLALIAGLGALAAGTILMALALLDALGDLNEVLDALSPSAGKVAVAAGGALVLGAGAALLVRFPAAVVPLLLLVAPFRPPLDPDPGASLLFALRPDALLGLPLPFYLALAAGALALAWRAARARSFAPIPRRLAYPAAALIALATVSVLWSEDPQKGTSEVLLLWLPYAALIAVVAHAPVSAGTARALAAIAIGLGCLFGASGIGQAIAGDVLFGTEALLEANATTGIVRTTSLFQDPSIYGRYLVVATGLILVALWMRRLNPRLGVALLALLGTALWFTYSQSSFVALAAVALGVAVLAGDRRVRLAMAGCLAAVALAGTVALGVAIATGSAADFTRNRSTLVTDTAAVFANHPIVGVGAGGQAAATRAEEDTGTTLGRATSHTTPLTIAAELGVVGLAAYVALLVGAVSLLLELQRRDPLLALGLAAVLLVLFLHALVYEGFFETPESLGALALACAALRRRNGGYLGDPARSRPSGRPPSDE